MIRGLGGDTAGPPPIFADKCSPLNVMAGHSRPKNGVASLAYVPAIHVFLTCIGTKAWMPGTRPGMTNFDFVPEKIGLRSV